MKQSLHGTWELVSRKTVMPDDRRICPLGPDAQGYINDSPDGFMFVHISSQDRAPFQELDLFGGTPAEDSASMKRHVSDAGRVIHSGDEVAHHVTHCSFPNWTGTQQRRNIEKLDDQTLVLSAHGAQIQGHRVTARLE